MSRTRLASLAVLALVAVPVLSACNTSPGAAVIIGSHRITTGQLQSQVNDAVSVGKLTTSPGFTSATFNRELLTHLIAVQITAAVAKQHHVTLTRQEIAAQTASFVQQAGGSMAALRQQAAEGGVSPRQLPGFIAFAALQQKLSTALTATLPATPAQLAAEYQKDIDQYDQVDIAQIEVKTKAQAEHIRSQVEANPSLFATLAKQHSLDTTTAAKGGEVGFVGRSELTSVLGRADQAAKTGSYVIAHTTTDYSVVHIISRRVTPISAVTTQLKEAMFATQGTALLQKALEAEASKLGVHVSPRYGRWDNTKQEVVAVTSAVSTAG